MKPHPPYTPPFPPRHKGGIPATELLAKARRGLLEVWGEEMFQGPGTALDILGQRLVVLSQPEAIEAVLVTQSSDFAAKPAQLRKLLTPLLGEGLFMADAPGRRSAVEAAQLGPALLAATAEAAQGLLGQWVGKPQGHVMNLAGAMRGLVGEILCRALFGAERGRPAAAALTRLAADYAGKISGAGLITMLALPETLARLRVSGEARRIHALVDPLIAAGQGLAGAMALAGMRPKALREEVISLFTAGHESLAHPLTTAWFLLAEAPWAEAALHAELAAVLEGRAPAVEDLPHLPVTRAILSEALRLYPAFPIIARVAARNTQVAGVAIPKGGIVFVAPWLVHRHQRHWQAPDEFRPERFLPGAPRPAPFTYLPFGLGARLCPAEDFALQVAMMALASLAQHVRLASRPGHQVEPQGSLTLSLGERLPMRLERR